MVKRIEFVGFLGGKNGRKYYVDPEDGRKIILSKILKSMRPQKRSSIIENMLESFESGYNTLEEIDGALCEVMESQFVRIERRAYLKDFGSK